MKYTKTSSTAFPLIEVTLQEGESIRMENGSMVYHDGTIELKGKMNSNGKNGVSGLLSAIGRSATGGESFFITTATGTSSNSKIALAPATVGEIKEIEVGSTQWRLNTGAFLACDTNVNYNMVRQKLDNAIFGGTGGLFVMETAGNGSMLINGYGDIVEIELTGQNPMVIDNLHVLAWTTGLEYKIKQASGFIGFKTGEGLVNEFHGVGKVLIQTRNIEGLAGLIDPFITKS